MKRDITLLLISFSLWIGLTVMVSGCHGKPLPSQVPSTKTGTMTNKKPHIPYLPQPGLAWQGDRLTWNRPDTLPSPFAQADGSPIRTVAQWKTRRKIIKKQLETYMYGPRPTFSIDHVEIAPEYPDLQVSPNAVTYTAKIFYDATRFFTIRITRPAEKGRYPVIMRYESLDHFRFPIEAECVGQRKYMIVALNPLTVAPDKTEVTAEYMHETKVIMAWAYAASLTVDYLEGLDYADCSKIAIAGMSRTGKSAICAGVYDKRFTIIIANSSGAGGASGMRHYGEKGTQAINLVQHQPTWVSGMLEAYRKDATQLPLDMHYARALIAPRVILTTEAADGPDAIWAGKISVYKMWAASDYAFRLYGVPEHNLIHLRPGEHLQLPEDYARMMQVINHVCYGEPLNTAEFRVNRF